MRVIAALTSALLCQIGFAAAQTPDEVKSDVLSALSTPLPITVIGPIITRDVKITPSGDGFLATLDSPMLMGIVPLGSLSFKLTPAGDRLYHVTDLTLPKSLDILNGIRLSIGGTTFDGMWNAQTRSYGKLSFKLDNVSAVPKGAQNIKVQLGSISLDVAKQAEAGATESKFLLQASDLLSKGFPPENISVKNLKIELDASGPEPVDLYAVLARFAVLAMTQQGQGNTALQFAESLRAKSYDKVALNLSADGVEAIGAAQGSTDRLSIGAVSGTADLTKVTPDEWGTVAITLNGKGIRDQGVAGVKEMDADTGTVSVTGTQIPIGATLTALSKLQSLSNGEETSLKMSDVLDGLFNIGALKFSSSADGVVYLPLKKDDPSLQVGKYSFETGTEGFRDNKGRLFFATGIDNLNWEMHKFDTDLQKKTMAVLNPKAVRYDLGITELNESLLRKLMGDVVINTKDDYAALAAPAITYFMAMKPVIESKDVRYQSSEIDMASSGLVRFYPAWTMGGLPYEGESKISLKGLAKILSLLDELKNAPPPPAPDNTVAVTPPAPADAAPAVDPNAPAEGDAAATDPNAPADGADAAAPDTSADGTDAAAPDKPADASIAPPPASSDNRVAYTVVKSVLETFRALAHTDGDKLSWVIKYPKANEGLFIVNDTELRYPNIASSLAPLMGIGMFK